MGSPANRPPHAALRSALPGQVFSFLSGLPGAKLPLRSKTGRVCSAIGLFVVGIAGGLIVASRLGLHGLPLLLLFNAVVISAARYLQLCILHHAAHGNVFGGSKDIVLGRLLATMLFIERFDSYAARHVISHHGPQSVSTTLDDTVRFLRETVGIVPGDSIEANRSRFMASLLSPRVHAAMLWQRIHSQLLSGSWISRLVATSYLGGVITFALLTETWLAVLSAWVMPITVGYQIAQCARLIVEHHWPKLAGHRTPREHDVLTVAVRCVPPRPECPAAGSLLLWYLDVAFNALIRCLVLPGDSGPSHAWHHGRPRGDWANHIAEAAAWNRWRLAHGRGETPQVWGYRAALTSALESYAQASPASLEPSATARSAP